VRNSSLVERQGIDNKRALSVLPKLWLSGFYSEGVGEHSNDAEGELRGLLELLEKQM
jgi:hypothetical protein